MKGSQRYGKSARIQTRTEFMYVMRAKQSAGDANLVVYVVANDLAWNRLGISVSKRIGNAVDRHYVRRRIREAFRTSRDDLPTGVDIVCVAKQGATDRSHNVRSSLVALVRRAFRRKQRGSRDRERVTRTGHSTEQETHGREGDAKP